MKTRGIGKAKVALVVNRANGSRTMEAPPKYEAIVDGQKFRFRDPVPSDKGSRMPILLTNPVTHKLREYVEANRQYCTEVPQQNQHAQQYLALCGAGPSLRKSTFEGVHHVWACNSALPYLYAQGVENLAGVGIDQTPRMLHDWSDAPDVTYYVASSCDPELVRYLLDRGRRVVFFHNAVGMEVPGYESEFEYYRATWPDPCVMVGEGATVVARVIFLAQAVGFERIDVHGADCCVEGADGAHANGETGSEAYATPMYLEGEVNGRTFRSRPDMLMTAIDLVRKVRTSHGTIRLVGDTLPAAILGKPDEWLDLLMRRLTPGELTPIRRIPEHDNGK